MSAEAVGKLKEQAIELIRDVHGDTSVSILTTKSLLEEIAEETQSLIEAVNADLGQADD